MLESPNTGKHTLKTQKETKKTAGQSIFLEVETQKWFPFTRKAPAKQPFPSHLFIGSHLWANTDLFSVFYQQGLAVTYADLDFLFPGSMF